MQVSCLKKLLLSSSDIHGELQECFFLSGVSVATCMAILQVGSGLQLRAASTGSKEEDYENDAATIVQKCVGVNSQDDSFLVFETLLVLRFSSFQQLEIYEMIGQAISNSRRAGGEVGEHFATEYITLMRMAHVWDRASCFNSIIRTFSSWVPGACWTACIWYWTWALLPWLIKGRRRIPWQHYVSETSPPEPRTEQDLLNLAQGKGKCLCVLYLKWWPNECGSMKYKRIWFKC